MSAAESAGAVITPWGPAADLRGRMLHPGPGNPQAEVRRNQRERLLGAMVASVAVRGYGEVSVADLVEISGVSKRTFYSLFDSKGACFEAAIKATLLAGIEAGLGSPTRGVSWEEQLIARVESLAQTVVAQPAAAKMCLIEAFAAGPEALAVIDEAVSVLEGAMASNFEAAPERRGMPAEMIGAFVGAGLELSRARLRTGEEAGLLSASRSMSAMIASYRPPPEPLRLRSRVQAPAAEPVNPNDPGQRIMDAFATVASERGYPAAKISAIAKAAGISPSTFYSNFAGKEDVLMATIDSAGAQLAARVLPAFRRATEWSQGVRASFGGILNFFAARPALARLLFVEIYAAGPEALERRAEALRPLGAILADGRARYPHVTPLQVETLAGFFYTLAYRRVRGIGAEGLPSLAPLCTYMTLFPFIGAAAACEAANGDGLPRGRVVERVERMALSRVLIILLKPHPKTAAELSEETGLGDEEVGRAIAELEALDLVGEVGVKGHGRTAEPLYRTISQTLEDEAWHNLGLHERQEISAAIVSLVIEDIELAVQTGTFDARPDRLLARVPLFVDEEGWRDMLDAQAQCIQRLLQIQAESAERVERTRRPLITGRSMHAMFEIPKRSA